MQPTVKFRRMFGLRYGITHGKHGVLYVRVITEFALLAAWMAEQGERIETNSPNFRVHWGGAWAASECTAVTIAAG